jgi:hypothetical protein
LYIAASLARHVWRRPLHLLQQLSSTQRSPSKPGADRMPMPRGARHAGRLAACITFRAWNGTRPRLRLRDFLMLLADPDGRRQDHVLGRRDPWDEPPELSVRR